ncbi:MAG: hypothetical protein GVX78_04750, partial [Bacteroidetes bacterium]|nr:hypothetical protein [Bacteroidota bacterium]
MAQRKKTRKRKKRFDYKSWSPSERWRKIIGVFVGAFSLYLGLAYLSYTTSWKADQAEIYQFEWGHFFAGDLPATNLTGRLGAILSHQMIYWGFGVPSIALVLLGFKYAYELWRKIHWYSTLRFTFYTLFITAFLSVVFDFAFSSSEFPWGGAFGESMQIWLSNFLGDIGLFFLILTIVIAYFIWLFNPQMKPIPVAKWMKWIQASDIESASTSLHESDRMKTSDGEPSENENKVKTESIEPGAPIPHAQPAPRVAEEIDRSNTESRGLEMDVSER